MIFDGKYQQIKLLGAGAFGKVFLAEELLTKRKVAIKIIQQSSLSSGKLLINEIKQISKFQHDHIIAYYHHFQQNGLLHLVMEYCEGGTLRQRLHSKKYTASDVIDWAISLTNALREIHKKGVFHKDIKPDNILFTKNGTIKLGDFGIANLHTGTTAYMSPEALNYDHSNQRLIDIYALGITITEMLVGKHPFTSLNKKEIDAMHKKQNYPIDKLPNWQQNFIKKAIHPDPLKRYQFMAEMEESLQAQSIPLEFNQLFFNNYKLLELVEKELSHKKWMKALHLLESVEKNSPNELLVHQGFANYYLQRGEFEKAKIRINQAFKLNNRIPYFKELGWIYLEECNYQKVIPLLTDYLRRMPNDLEGFNLLIRAYYETKRMDEALKLSTILHQQHPKLACFLNNLLVSYYCVHAKIPSDISPELKQNNHPLVDYNLALIQESVKNKMDAQSKLIFMNFNHNTMKENKIRIQSLDQHRSNTFESSDPVILIGRNAEDTINIGLQNNKGISRMHCVVLNSKNDVWIYDLKSVNGTYINGEKIKLRQLLSGVQKLTLDQVDFWIHSDAEKLL